MRQSGWWIFNSVAVLLGLFILECSAKHRSDSMRQSSISCYQCNSEFDPRCGDPFDPYTIGVVNCSMRPKLDHIELPPTLCRKIVQKVEGKVRVIRSCGYIPDSRDDRECVKRTGTHDVHVLYCACKNALCNGAHLIRNRPLVLFTLIPSALSALLVKLILNTAA